MHWIKFTEVLTLQTLLALVLSASLLTTAQSRVVLVKDGTTTTTNNNNSNINNDGGDSSSTSEDASSSSASSSSSSAEPSSSNLSVNDSYYYGDQTKDLEDWYAAPDSNEEEEVDDEEEEDYFDDNMDMWPVLCPPNNFYSLVKDECTTCTPCPADTFMVKSCHRFDDNTCLPVTSFHSGEDGISNGDSPSPRTSVSDDDSIEWKSVSLTLLICTSVIFLCLVSVGAVFCYLKRRAHTATVTKEILCNYSPAPRFPIVKVAEV